MSTRSRIGMVQADGKVVSIYCHNDGYVQGVGDTLLHHYTDPKKVESLISLGDISSLHENIDPDPKGGEERFFDVKTYHWKTRPAKGKHSFDRPQMGVVVAYGRDRGEDPEIIKPRVDESAEAFTKGDVEEWGYLFKDGKWFYVDGHKETNRRRLKPLTEKVVTNPNL